MVELVDTLDLGSSVARRGGSSPLFGTIYRAGIFRDSGFFIGSNGSGVFQGNINHKKSDLKNCLVL